MFLIHETKLSNLQDGLVNSFGVTSRLDIWSGDILTMWKKGMVDVISIFKGNGYLGIKILWKNDFYYIVNIYFSCDLMEKRILWNRL